MKTPVICPKGSRVVVTQGFKPEIHESVDFIIWDDKLSHDDNKFLTYGASFVAPFDFKVVAEESKEKTVGYYGQDAPSGGYIDIVDSTGKFFLHFQHNCANRLKVGDVGKAGDIIGYMGNAGQCLPAPTPDYPVDGTHCHLTMALLGVGPNGNGIRVDPRIYIDFNTWYDGEDSSKELDYERIKWGLDRKGFKTMWEEVVWLIRRFGNKQ